MERAGYTREGIAPKFGCADDEKIPFEVSGQSQTFASQIEFFRWLAKSWALIIRKLLMN